MTRRRGRKRQDGERELNGRTIRHHGPDRGPDERQDKTLHLVDDIGGGVDINDALSVLHHLGHITSEQESAGVDYGRAHRALFGRPWPKSGEALPGRSLIDDRGKLEAKVRRAQDIIGKAGGNAVRICRFVCVANLLPVWAHPRPVVTTVTVAGRRNILKASRDRDRIAIRAMVRDLPALKKALDSLYRAGYGVTANRVAPARRRGKYTKQGTGLIRPSMS